MNKYFIILLISIFILTACEKVFHDEDSSYIVLDTEQEKIDVLNGIYLLINKVHNYNYFGFCARADDINIYNNYSFGPNCSQSNPATITLNEIELIYKRLYAAIGSSNSIIMQSANTEHEYLLGEAQFLRAYCYLKLARFFGTPPLVTDTDINYTVKKPDFKQVYEQIENDLLNAINNLPDNISEARMAYESPTKYTAKALLAEVYLSMAGYPVYDVEKYSLAADLAGEVIQSGEYALLADMAKLWKENNKHHSENIFGLFYHDESMDTDNWYNTLDPSNNVINAPRISSFSGYNDEIDIYYPNVMKPDFSFFSNYPDNYRKRASFMTGKYDYKSFVDPDGSNVEALYFNEANPLVDPCFYCSNVRLLKHVDYEGLSNAQLFEKGSGCRVTLSIIRYAQTLLTFAEAKARIGEMDASAFEAVNKVRRRANKLDIHTASKYDLTPGLSQDQFTDSVVWERAWELCFEPEGRWFDIIRLDMKDEIEQNRSDIDIITEFLDPYITEDWYFLKLPEHDIFLNPNLE
ncbi:MAG: RagB/SusD family nutrient uptake outer membrane protein [Salinivirgaceae bacterium]|jgi:hypothetical protein|nr:RagB/SusD family nutrient uptake outer membrane protein [Salinivirgaceae bacterium]